MDVEGEFGAIVETVVAQASPPRPPDPPPPDPATEDVSSPVTETTPVPSSSASSHSEHDYSNPTPNNPYSMVQQLTEENRRLKAKAKNQKCTITNLRDKVSTMKRGNVPKYTKNIIVRKALKRTHTEAQMDWLLSEQPRKRSRKWSNEDFTKGYKLLLQGEKTLDLVRKIAAPFPCQTLIMQKFNFLSTKPGIQTHVRTYIKIHLAHTEMWKNNGNIIGVGFDEFSLAKIGMYYAKLDIVLGGILDRNHCSVFHYFLLANSLHSVTFTYLPCFLI